MHQSVANLLGGYESLPTSIGGVDFISEANGPRVQTKCESDLALDGNLGRSRNGATLFIQVKRNPTEHRNLGRLYDGVRWVESKLLDRVNHALDHRETTPDVLPSGE